MTEDELQSYTEQLKELTAEWRALRLDDAEIDLRTRQWFQGLDKPELELLRHELAEATKVSRQLGLIQTGASDESHPAEDTTQSFQPSQSPLTQPESESAPPPVTLDVGDVRPQVRTEARHLWAQELVRASLAIILLAILAVTVGWAFVGAGGAAWPNYKELLQLVLPAETALLGSAAGFYFGTRRN